MNPNKYIKQYYETIWKEIARHQKLVTTFHKDVLMCRIGKQDATIRTAQPLKFYDDATLRFNEKIMLTEQGIIIEKYSYHYERYHPDGSIEFYFRYDKDPNATKADDFSQTDWEIAHAENHLHVNCETPRYKTHETHFIEVFNLIRLNYYRY